MSRRTGFSQEVRELILYRAQGHCEVMARVCSLSATDIHHRRPRAMGGTVEAAANQAANGIAICRRCHMHIESNREWALDNGFLLRQGVEPEEATIWWRCAHNTDGTKRWLILRNDGEKQIVGNGDTTEFTW